VEDPRGATVRALPVSLSKTKILTSRSLCTLRRWTVTPACVHACRVDLPLQDNFPVRLALILIVAPRYAKAGAVRVLEEAWSATEADRMPIRTISQIGLRPEDTRFPSRMRPKFNP
jgi:hypothetical protein